MYARPSTRVAKKKRKTWSMPVASTNLGALDSSDDDASDDEKKLIAEEEARLKHERELRYDGRVWHIVTPSACYLFPGFRFACECYVFTRNYANREQKRKELLARFSEQPKPLVTPSPAAAPYVYVHTCECDDNHEAAALSRRACLRAFPDVFEM